MMHQLKDINHRHEQIVNWLILNPDKPLGDCARFFGYSQPWLSQVVHSDMFQALYQERCRAVGALAVHTIANELGVLTAETIEKCREKLQIQPSERFLGDTLRTTLQALGYGASPSNGNGVVNVQVNAQTIIQARERAATQLEGKTPAKQDGRAISSPNSPNFVQPATAFVQENLMEEGEAA
jgi:hypothetical protein